jgi:hypothetical protein
MNEKLNDEEKEQLFNTVTKMDKIPPGLSTLVKDESNKLFQAGEKGNMQSTQQVKML